MTIDFGVNEILVIVRTIVYVWVGVEFMSLAYLYYYGYDHLKPTPVIKALQRLLFWNGIMILFLSFMPIIGALNGGIVYDISRALIILFLLPVGYYVAIFRKESITETKVKLPEDPKKSKVK